MSPAPEPATGRPAPPARAPRAGLGAPAVAGIAGVASLALFGGVWLALADTEEPAKATRDRPAPRTGAPSNPSASDPDRDPAAWRALPSEERERRAAKLLEGVARGSEGSLRWAHDFLRARAEDEAARRAAEMALASDPDAAWARESLGHRRLDERVARCLDECARAYELDAPEVLALRRLVDEHAPESGPWWAAPEVAERVDELIEAARSAERRLEDPFEHAVARWAAWRSRVEGLREVPALHASRGPYLAFAEVRARSGEPDRAAEARAARVLERSLALLESFHEAFSRDVAPRLGVEPLVRARADFDTLLKVNIFADEEQWRRHPTTGPLLASLRGVRAIYSLEEPRFVSTWDPGGAVPDPLADQVLCHEAAHQLVHVHTRERTRAATGRDVPWSECVGQPLWLAEGFAELVSGHRVEPDGTRRWLEPVPHRLAELAVLAPAIELKGWRGWSLEELLLTADDAALREAAAARVTDRPRRAQTETERLEVARATAALGMLYYGHAWSLCHFLWHAGGPDAPTYRDRFADLLRDSLVVELDARGFRVPRPGDAAFRRRFGLDTPRALAAFEAAWRAHERDLVERHRDPAWELFRKQTHEALGLR